MNSVDRRLAVTTFESTDGGQPGPGVLFVHGLHSSKQGYRNRALRVASEVEAVCVTFDLSGHGKSSGTLESLSIADHLVDVCRAYDRLAEHPAVDPLRIGICGASYGGYLSSIATSLRDVKRLVLRAPALYDDGIFSTPIELWPKTRTLVETERVFAPLRNFLGQVLVLESENDEVISSLTVRSYAEASANGLLEVIDGATHALLKPEWDEVFIKHLVRWFTQL